MELLVGAVLERTPGPKYTEALRYAELALAEPLPKASTLARWRQSLPESFRLGLRVPTSCWKSPSGPLRPSPSLDQGLGWLAEALEALRPSVLVVSTGATISTGSRDRQRLRDYFQRIPRHSDRVVVWRPTGLWEPESVAQMARSLDVVPGFDPTDDPVPEGDTLYASMRAEGLRQSFPQALLADTLERLQASGAARATVSIESGQSFREACLLAALSEGRA